jgi:predicted nucleotidyltransferase
MQAQGPRQRQVAELIEDSQSAESQELSSAPDLASAHPALLLEAATSVLNTLAADHGYDNLVASASVVMGEVGNESDLELVVDVPPGTSGFEFLGFKELLEQVLGREIDLVSRGGLKPLIDEDNRREAVLLSD